MFDKKYSVDDIIDEIKTKKMSPQEVEKYSKDFQKYDTSALLEEILGENTKNTKHFAYDENVLQNTLGQSPTIEQPQEKETQPSTIEKIQEQQTQQIPKQTPKEQPLEPIIKQTQEAPQPTQPEPIKEPELDLQPQAEVPQINKTEEIKIVDGYKEHKKHSTSQLKYIALQKNREKVVKEFDLKTKFMTDSVNFHKKELEQEIEAQKMLEESQEISADQINKFDTNKIETADKEPAKAKIISFAVDENEKDNENSATNSGQLEFDSNNNADDCLLALQKTRTNISVKIVVGIALFLITGIVTLMDTMQTNPMPVVSTMLNPLNFLIVNFVGLIGGIALLFDIIADGVLSVARLRLNKNTIFSLATIVLLGYSLYMLLNPENIANQSVHLYVPVLLLNSIIVLFAKRQEIKRVIKNFIFVSGAGEKYSIGLVDNLELAEDFTKGGLNDYPFFAVNKKTRFLSNFMKESFSEDLNDRKAKITLPIILGLAIIAGIVSSFFGNTIPQTYTIVTGVLLAGASGYTFLMISYPLMVCCEDVSKLGGAVLSYGAVEEFSDTNSVLLNANELFKPEDVTLFGIKTFPNIVIDRAILDATSVLCETKSVLSGVFLNIIENKKEYLDKVDSVMYEDGMGISAWVNNRRVLIGSRELMKHHNIFTPSKDYEKKYLSDDKYLIYLSAGGELSAVFIVGIQGNIESRNLLIDLYNDNFLSVIKTVDPILTKEELSKLFNMPENAFKVISSRLHKDANELTSSHFEESSKVCNNGNIFAFIYSLLWAKRLNRIISIGEILNFVTIGANISLFFAFILLSSVSQLDNRFLCIYQLAALLICLMLQKLNKIK